MAVFTIAAQQQESDVPGVTVTLVIETKKTPSIWLCQRAVCGDYLAQTLNGELVIPIAGDGFADASRRHACRRGRCQLVRGFHRGRTAREKAFAST
jgi:hypothetical protein